MTRFLEATRERFLLAIAATLPAERFIELHFFSPIRQGGVESGVAVIAAHPDPVLSSEAPPVIPSEARDLLLDSGEANGSAREQRARLRISSSASSESEKQIPRFARDDNPRGSRYTVYSAKYKLVLKGADRGKWECFVVAEADAPLVTVETVVRGVQRRSGDADEPERMSGDDARDALLTATR